MSKIGELYVQLDANISGFTKKLSDAERSLQNIGKRMEKVGRQLSMKLSLPLIALGTISVKAFADFDKSMTESTAIMGKLSDSVKKDMADLAKTISTKTTFSAKELAATYFYLASAGMDAQQSMQVLGDVAKFAQAGTFDLSTATDLLTDAQTALGLSSKNAAINQENLVRVSDVLVKANTLANASVREFAEALTSKAAASLSNVNKEVEEGVAVLAAYADKGIKGSLAGERLTMMMNGLFAATQQNSKAWDVAGISLYDANEKMRSIGDIISDLEVHLGGMTDKQKQATLAQLGFNVRTKDSILALMGSSEKIKQWTKDLKKAGGITQEVSDKQLESFSNRMKILKNRLTNVAITLGEKLAPVIEKIAKKIEKAAKWFSNLSDSTKETILKVAGLLAVLGPVLSVLGKILIVVPKLAMAFKFLAGSPMGLVITGLTIIIAKAIEAKKEFEKSMKLYQKEMELTGKKTGWFAKTWSSVSTAIEKTTTRLDINRIAQLEYNEQMRKAEGVISIVTGVTKVLSEGMGFLNEKIGGLLGNLPKTREEFSLMLTGFKNLSTETYDNLNPALRALWDSLGEKGGKGVNAAIKYTVTLAETAAKSIGSLTSSMENFRFATVDTQGVLDNLKPVMTRTWEEAIPPARNFSHVLDQVPTKLEGIETVSTAVGKKVKSTWEEVSTAIYDLSRKWADALGDALGIAEWFYSEAKEFDDSHYKNAIENLENLFETTKSKLDQQLAAQGDYYNDIIGKAEEDYEQKKKLIEASVGNEEEKQKMLAALEEKHLTYLEMMRQNQLAAEGKAREEVLKLESVYQTDLQALKDEEATAMDAHRKDELEKQKSIWNQLKKAFGEVIEDLLKLWATKFIGGLLTDTASGIKDVGKTISGVSKSIADTVKGFSPGGIAQGVISGAVSGLVSGIIGGKGGLDSTDKFHLEHIWINSGALKPIEGAADAIRDHVLRIANQTHGVPGKLDIANRHLQKIRDFTEPLSNIKFAASGISETVSSPTLYMAGEKGAERVNISPLGQPNFQPNISIKSTPVNINLDGQTVARGLLEHFADLSKWGHLNIHTSAIKDW